MLCPWGAPLADDDFPFGSVSKEVDAVSYFISFHLKGHARKRSGESQHSLTSVSQPPKAPSTAAEVQSSPEAAEF